MAEKKNITIKEYNGTDYDTLYPETNSGQVLLDKTAQTTLNLSSGKTLNDAVSNLSSGGAFNVGDILVTSRTDLDDRWLLCNGGIVSSTDYPDLGNVLTPITTGTWFEDGVFPTSPDYTGTHSLVQLGQKWGMLSTRSTTPKNKVFVLNNLKNGTITDTGLTALDTTPSYDGVTAVNDEKSMHALTTAFTDLFTSPDRSQVLVSKGKIIYNSNNGYYYNYVRRESSPFYVLIRRNNLTSNATTFQIEISTSSLQNFFGLQQFVNGYMIGVDANTDVGDYRYVPVVINEDGIVTRLDYNTPIVSSGSNVPYPTIQYFNEYYYGFGATTIYRRQSLTSGSWEAWKTMPNSVNSGIGYMGNNCILLTSGYTITADEQLVEWKNKPSFSHPIYVDEANNQYISQINETNKYRYTPITNFIKLPVWSPATGIYAYIKAKK